MTVLGWILFDLAAYVVLIVVVALAAGAVLRWRSRDYPVPDKGSA